MKRGKGKVKGAGDFAWRAHARSLLLQECLEGNAKEERDCHGRHHEGEELLLLEKAGEHDDERGGEGYGEGCVVECNRGEPRLGAHKPERVEQELAEIHCRDGAFTLFIILGGPPKSKKPRARGFFIFCL
jgi:hypothetical protein